MKEDFHEYYINNLYTTHAVVCWVTAGSPCVTHFHDQWEPQLPLSNTLEVAVENKAAIQFWKRLINRCCGFKLYCFGTLASKEILEV
jgi:hypothetical protein